MHLLKLLDFSALPSKVLFTLAFVAFRLNYDLHVVFYVGFRNFRKKTTLKINQLKIKRPLRFGWGYYCCVHEYFVMLGKKRCQIHKEMAPLRLLRRATIL